MFHLIARPRLIACAMAGALCALSAPVSAQDWPTRPVRIVSPFAAGGTASILARLMADQFSKVFKEQFYVETRPGAGGTLGIHAVAHSDPDGYSFGLTNVSVAVMAPLIKPNLGYNSDKDLVNIGYVAGSPVVLSVKSDSGIKTLADFIARAKASEKPLTYSSSGVGTMGHLVIESLAQQAGIKVEHVPYKGASQGITDVVGGHITASSQILGSVSSYVRSGSLTAIAHAGEKRIADYPKIPTFTELGYPNLVSSTWFAIVGPSGLPPEIVQKVNKAINDYVSEPATQKKLEEMGFVVKPMSPQGLNDFIRDETKRWKPMIDHLKLAGTSG